MSITRLCIILISLLLSVCSVHSQHKRAEICIDFRVNSSAIDSTYMDNAFRVQEIVDFLQSIRKDNTVKVVEVSFCGASSPEGSDQLNRRLAQGRLEALEALVRSQVEISDDIITRNDSYIPWDNLKAQIKSSNLARKDEVLAILNEEAKLVDYHLNNEHVDHRVLKLKALDEGKVWREMDRMFFSRIRNACMVLVTIKEELPAVAEPVAEPVVEPVPDTTQVAEVVAPVAEEWTRHLHLKTNALGWALANANIGAEIDLAKHLSLTVPVYYSAINYFTNTIKFRTLGVQPELRYWLDENNEKFFIGAHFGCAQYNVAINGDYRYQDHDGKTPAVGGGVSVGYRMPISANGKWYIEFALGAGAYALNYDRFYNVNNGKLVDTNRKTYFGIDNAAVNISYRFDLNKRKR